MAPFPGELWRASVALAALIRRGRGQSSPRTGAVRGLMPARRDRVAMEKSSCSRSRTQPSKGLKRVLWRARGWPASKAIRRMTRETRRRNVGDDYLSFKSPSQPGNRRCNHLTRIAAEAQDQRRLLRSLDIEAAHGTDDDAVFPRCLFDREV